MKYFFKIAALLALFIFPTVEADAACGAGAGTCFVVAAGGNSNSTSTWSATTGGATCTCVPAATDAVILDSVAGQLTVNAALAVASLDASGTGGSGSPYTNTLTQSSASITISGNLFKLVAGMTFAPANVGGNLINFTSTSGITQITSAGKHPANVTFNGAGGTFRLQDNLFVQNTATLTSGTLSLNSFSLTATTYTGTGSTTRVFNCGAGGGFIFGNQFGGFDTSGTSVTTDGSCGITLSAASSSSGRQLNLGTSLTFASLTITQTSNSAPDSIDGTTPTITTGNINGPATVTFGSGTTSTITNFNITGTSSNPVLISSANFISSIATINTTTSVMTWVGFRNITFGTSAVSPTNCIAFALTNFNGGTCSPPSGGGGGGRIIGG